MSAHEFIASVTIIVATMALIAVVELIQPLFIRTARYEGRTATNLGLTVMTLSLNWALTMAAAVIALTMPLHGPGFMDRLGVPFVAQIIAGVVVLDFFFGYFAHRAMHLSPLLWRAHRIHHCDPFVDVTTTYRNHPIEGIWRFVWVIVPVWVLGLPAEAVVIHKLLSAINGLFEHANLRLWPPLDRALSVFWVTPQMHKVHHSRVCEETDTNYGNIFSVFDRMLHTFTATDRAFSVAYGIDDIDTRRAISLPALLAMPFQLSESLAGHPTGSSGVEQAT